MASPSFDFSDIDRISPELWRLLGRAVLLTRASDETEDVQINFSTLLIAFLASDDPISRWFQGYVRADGIRITLERLYDSKSIEPDELDRVRKDEAPEKYLSQIKEVSYSTSRLLDQAVELVERLGSRRTAQDESASRLDVRHVMGAYIYYPSGHEEQLAGWGFDREHWSNAFLTAIVQISPLGEAEIHTWQEIHVEVFGSPPGPAAEEEPPEPPAESASAIPGAEPETGPESASAVPASASGAPPDGSTETPGAGPEPPPGVLPAALAERLVGYDADRATGQRADDLLNITPDVNALAALIAAKDTVPSLAIGIFGDWGSGKTFFMRSLMRRIDELTAAARSTSVDQEGQLVPEQPQSQITFYKRIVQIEFNAWHYVEGKLWASLVEHIFSNLRISQDEGWDPHGLKLQTLQRRLLDQLEGVQQAAQQADREAQEALRKLEKTRARLDSVRAERDRKQSGLEDVTTWRVITRADWAPVRDVINGALRAAGFSEAPEEIAQAQEALDKARALLSRGRGVITPLVRAEDRKRRRWLLLVALLVGPAIAVLAATLARLLTQEWTQAWLAQIARWVAAGVSLLGPLTAWVGAQLKWASARLGKIEEARDELQALQDRELAEYTARIEQLQERVRAQEADAEAAAQKARDAREAVQAKQQELRQAAPAHRLARFIEDRTESDDYRKHLGLLALVRRDFQALSEYIEGENERLAKLKNVDQELDGVDERINRIVLYIDDLDRCPAENVVQVLQAVHLLLAFPLFVVVVGVDARWVSRALEQHYPHLKQENEKAGGDGDPLGFGRDATPHDYLEKIFQIPVWLHPIGERGSRQMLDGLLKDKVVPPAEPPTEESLTEDQPVEEKPTEEPPIEEGPADEPPTEETPADELPDEEPPPEEEPDGEEPAEEEPEADEPPIDLTPESLEIVTTELAFMKELAGIVGRSPRAIKRFVNLYRLLKATLDQTETPLSVGAPLTAGAAGTGSAPQPSVSCPPLCDHEVVLFLLAVVTGLPDVSRRLFETIREGTDENEAGHEPPRDLAWALEQLRAMAAGVRAAEGDLARLESWLGGYQGGAWLPVPLGHFDRRAGQVARYSFRVEQR